MPRKLLNDHIAVAFHQNSPCSSSFFEKPSVQYTTYDTYITTHSRYGALVCIKSWRANVRPTTDQRGAAPALVRVQESTRLQEVWLALVPWSAFLSWFPREHSSSTKVRFTNSSVSRKSQLAVFQHRHFVMSGFLRESEIRFVMLLMEIISGISP